MGGGGPRPIIRLCAINFDKNEGPFLSTKWGIMKFSSEEKGERERRTKVMKFGRILIIYSGE